MQSPLCQEQCLTDWAIYWSHQILSIGTPGGPEGSGVRVGSFSVSLKEAYTAHLREARAAKAKLEAEKSARASLGLPQGPPSLIEVGGNGSGNLPNPIGEAIDKVEDVAKGVANALLNGLRSAVCGEKKAEADDGGVTLCPK